MQSALGTLETMIELARSESGGKSPQDLRQVGTLRGLFPYLRIDEDHSLIAENKGRLRALENDNSDEAEEQRHFPESALRKAESLKQRKEAERLCLKS